MKNGLWSRKCLLGFHYHFSSIACMGTCTAVLYVAFLSSFFFPSFFLSFSLSLNGSSLSSLPSSLSPALSPQVVGLNFSSVTTPELLLKTFDHYCEYKRTPNGVVMELAQLGKWLVLFCDVINLPDLINMVRERRGRDRGRGGVRGKGR